MIVQSKRVWIAEQFIAAQIEIDGGKIARIAPYGAKAADADYGDLRIVPGFMDVHCHGGYGFDTNDADGEGLRNWAKKLAEEGVTAFLPTTVTQSEETLCKALENVADVMADQYEGAEILGIHLEGPFLNAEHKGAQPEAYIVKPAIGQFARYQAAARGNIRYVTMATENDEDFALTRCLAEAGIVVSVGHSAATYEQACMAFANGAKSMTHVYNGMTPFHHRANGLVGAAMRLRTMYGEVICDGNHSTPAALNTFFMSKGPDYAVMVSDALMVKGIPAGSRCMFGGNEICVCTDGSARLVGSETLAGSTLKLNEGLRLLVEEALVPFNYAIHACTLNPANCLGIAERKGSIRVGKDADLVVLESDYRVHQTYCRGKPQK